MLVHYIEHILLVYTDMTLKERSQNLHEFAKKNLSGEIIFLGILAKSPDEINLFATNWGGC